MDTKSKVIFLKEVYARKTELFSKADSKVKDELWHTIYDVCLAKGCIGLRDAEYLRRTTYQNLQRRAKEKYEKGLKIGMEHVNLSEVDELILDIIGRDKCTPASDILSDNNLQTLLGFIAKSDQNGVFNKDDSLDNTSPFSLHDQDELKHNGYPQKSESPFLNGHAQSPDSEPTMDMQPKLPEVITSLFQSFVSNNSSTTTQPMNNLSLKRKRAASATESDDEDSLEDLDEKMLKKRKIQAEIRLINAQFAVQEKEAKLKDLQILALKRELGLNSLTA